MARDSTEYLLDIVRAARRAQAFVADCAWEQFAADVKTQWAVDRALGIIGEAVNHLDDAARQHLGTTLPVRSIIALRNLIAHEYWVIDAGLTWQIATQQMAPLLAAVGELLPVRIGPALPADGAKSGESAAG